MSKPCEDCDGTGLVDCPNCGTPETDECDYCDGTGEVDEEEEES